MLECYAMNVAKDAIWLYYYTDFPITRLGYDGKLQTWTNSVHGATAIVAQGAKAALYGRYHEPNVMTILELSSNSTAVIREERRIVLPDGQAPERVYGRGLHFHTLQGNLWCRMGPWE